MPENISPSFGASRFNCPHCHALAHQYWHRVFLDILKSPPGDWSFDKLREHLRDFQSRNADEDEDDVKQWLTKMSTEKPFALRAKQVYADNELHLYHVSQCYSCLDFAVWRLGRLVNPSLKLEIEPNPDMPAGAIADFREAAEIFEASPKGAAALLRLALQRILVRLGQPGKNINDDIGALVASGLPVVVQQALDVVRVVGNNAVHPVHIDIDDNKDVALKLFILINIIVEQMITHPKQIAEMFGNLPESYTKSIAKRDTPKITRSAE